MHCTTLLAIFTLAILLHRGICLVCNTCYSEKSFEDCDQQSRVIECPPEVNDTCATYINFSGKKFFAKACSEGRFCSKADYHCCATDECNTGEIQTQPPRATGEKSGQTSRGTGEKSGQSSRATCEKSGQSSRGTGEMGTQLASGLLLGAWAIGQLVQTVLLY